MRLRAITLVNVRHFAGRKASLSGIGDGITVLSEPNEFGKSTFFDALQALFFEKHRSTRAAVRTLQPHAGGAPEVTVGVDLPQGRFNLTKRWLSRAMARVTDAEGQVIAQDDEAEAWILATMGAGIAGPTGLLWVRQGLLGLEPDDRAERDRNLMTRRDLMSAVAGEIAQMTGGRRMDMVLDRTATALAGLATATGKPRAGGNWALAVQEAADLAVQDDDLRQKVGRLGDDLRQRVNLMRAQAALADPAATLARDARLAAAQAAHQVAVAHAGRVADVAQTLKVAALQHEATSRDMTALEQRSARLLKAIAARDRAAAATGPVHARADDLAHKARVAADVATSATIQVRGLRHRLAVAQQARLAAVARQQITDLEAKLAHAVLLQQRLAEGRAARAQLRITPDYLVQAEAAQVALDRLTAQAAGQVVTVKFTYNGAARAMLQGQPVGDAAVGLHGPATFSLPGFGDVRINPGTGPGMGAGTGPGVDMAARLAVAQAKLAACLEACGADDLLGARQRAMDVQRLDQDAQHQGRLLADVAPDGVDALRQALAMAQMQAAAAPNPATGEVTPAGEGRPDDVQQVAGLLAIAETAEADAMAAANAAAELAISAITLRVTADADLHHAAREAAAASSDVGDPVVMQAALCQLQDAGRVLDDRRAHLRAEHQQLVAGAPDMETAVAALAMATSASEQARHEAHRLREDLAGLNTRIDILAEQGIEETCLSVAGQRLAAEARAQRYGAEVRALSRLRRALDDARTQAREAYFGPVLHELEPLLAILHPGAALRIDDQTLLPADLTRRGMVEPLDILSGGTREQLAILTRLAFARLFARSGLTVPVILDDALVHSDDDRIEAMFTTLHRVARDQQILVLTCRQRAFATLGGDRIRAVVTDM